MSEQKVTLTMPESFARELEEALCLAAEQMELSNPEESLSLGALAGVIAFKLVDPANAERYEIR